MAFEPQALLLRDVKRCFTEAFIPLCPFRLDAFQVELFS